MYERHSVTEVTEKADKADMIMNEGPEDFLTIGLKFYDAASLIAIANKARHNIHTTHVAGGKLKSFSYMMRLGFHHYQPETVLKAIKNEIKVRINEHTA